MKNRKTTVASTDTAAKARHNNGASLHRFRKLFSDPELAHLTQHQRLALVIALDDDWFDVAAAKHAVLMLFPASAAPAHAARPAASVGCPAHAS